MKTILVYRLENTRSHRGPWRDDMSKSAEFWDKLAQMSEKLQPIQNFICMKRDYLCAFVDVTVAIDFFDPIFNFLNENWAIVAYSVPSDSIYACNDAFGQVAFSQKKSVAVEHLFIKNMLDKS